MFMTICMALIMHLIRYADSEKGNLPRSGIFLDKMSLFT